MIFSVIRVILLAIIAQAQYSERSNFANSIAWDEALDEIAEEEYAALVNAVLAERKHEAAAPAVGTAAASSDAGEGWEVRTGKQGKKKGRRPFLVQTAPYTLDNSAAVLFVFFAGSGVCFAVLGFWRRASRTYEEPLLAAYA